MRTHLSLCILALLLLTGAAVAQTPDGETPAEETGCDGDPISFGLCNAYCEAMDCDCDPADPVNPCTPNASEAACDRVFANYQKKAGNPTPEAQPSCGGDAVVVDCPAGSGDCLAEHESGGCTCTTCSDKVIDTDSWCGSLWDNVCVDLADNLCSFG